MAEVGGQQTQLAGRVGSLTMPVTDGGDREGVSQAVDLRSSPVRLGFESDLGEELAEHVVHGDVEQPRPTYGDEEAGRLGVWAELVPNLHVDAQCGARRLVQREPAVFAELRQRDVQHPGPQVHVLAVEADRLTDPHACDRQQPKQRLVSRAPQSWTKGAGDLEQPGDVGLGVQIRSRVVARTAQQVRRRDLNTRVQTLQVAGEAADHTETMGPLGRGSIGASGGPGQRGCARDGGRA